jgi:hypothetical protein
VLTALRIPRPSVALVVAFAALFIALGGTGYAALKITGKNVVNESLTGADVDNKSLSWREFKKDTLGGDQIKESALGSVPEAAHAANADNATNAQTAAKATDADTVGGIPAAQLMTTKSRAYEDNFSATDNFANNAVLETMPDLPPGQYVVTAKLSYYHPGATEQEACTLEVPGGNDSTSFIVEVGDSETITMHESLTSDAVFSPRVYCTSDGNDDTIGTGSIIAVRLD